MVTTQSDILVADLEDGVPGTDKAKDDARQGVAEWLGRLPSELRATRAFVRINPSCTPWFIEDLKVLTACDLAGLLLPKTERPDEVAALRSLLGERAEYCRVIAGIETARGLDRVESIAESPDVDALYFGAEDYITDVGGRRTSEGGEVHYARSRVALASRLGAVPAIDQVLIDFKNLDAFAAEAFLARNLGFSGKMCIHPDQVPVAIQEFSPSDAELDYARRVITAAKEAAISGRGVVTVAGAMIDAPLVERAQRVLDVWDMERNNA